MERWEVTAIVFLFSFKVSFNLGSMYSHRIHAAHVKVYLTVKMSFLKDTELLTCSFKNKINLHVLALELRGNLHDKDRQVLRSA